MKGYQSRHFEGVLFMAIDPVCGMEVDERTANEKAMHQGESYFFCSKECKEEFEADPEEYTGGEMATGT
jgi:YHS domain-containing protein